LSQKLSKKLSAVAKAVIEAVTEARAYLQLKHLTERFSDRTSLRRTSLKKVFNSLSKLAKKFIGCEVSVAIAK
jgi:hypothetical protein